MLCLVGCDLPRHTKSFDVDGVIEKVFQDGSSTIATITFKIHETEFRRDIEVSGKWTFTDEPKPVKIQVVFSWHSGDVDYAIYLHGVKIWEMGSSTTTDDDFYRTNILYYGMTKEEVELFKNPPPVEEKVVQMTPEQIKEAQERGENAIKYMVYAISAIVALFMFVVFKPTFDKQLRLWKVRCNLKELQKFNKLEVSEMLALIEEGERELDDIKSEHKREFVKEKLDLKYNSLRELQS